jgi:hypothetical protein
MINGIGGGIQETVIAADGTAVGIANKISPNPSPGAAF